jgi:hypothetical protein
MPPFVWDEWPQFFWGVELASGQPNAPTNPRQGRKVCQKVCH